MTGGPFIQNGSRVKRVLNTILGLAVAGLCFAAFFAVVDVLRATFDRVFHGHWNFYTNAQALGALGIHATSKVAAWPLSLTVLLGVVGIFGVISDLKNPAPPPAPKPKPTIKKGTTVPKLPAFITVRNPKTGTTIAVRLGRVMHWTAIVFAAFSFGLSAYLAIHSYSLQAESLNEMARWDQAHPYPNKPGYVYTSAPDGYGGFNYKPTEHVPEPEDLLVGAGFALFFLLSGRGARYILGGE